MLPLHATHANTRRQDRLESNSSRRPDADRARLLAVWEVISGMVTKGAFFKWNEARLYIYIINECYILPILLGESDKVMPCLGSPTQIARTLGIDPGDASRALRALISKGFLKLKGGRIWPTRSGFDRLRAMVDPPRAAIRAYPQFPEASHPTETSHGNSPSTPATTMGNSHAEPGPTMGNSHAKSGPPICESRAELNSDSGEDRKNSKPNVCVNSGEEKAYSGAQEASTHTHTDACLDAVPFPWTDEDTATIDRFADEQLLNIRVATECRRLIRGLYPAPWVVKAMKRAKTKNINSFSYIRQILVQWESAGEPNPGAEDHYDDSMQPIKARRLPDLAPAAAPAMPSRFPPSRADQAEADYQKSMEMIAKGICPWTGKPLSEVINDD